MRVALPIWNGRVSPVFDVAEHFSVFDVQDGVIKDRSTHNVEKEGRVVTLWKLGVDVVICGAVSRQLEAALWVAGIDVISEICGPVDMVIRTFLRGALSEGTYFSPCHSESSREMYSPPANRG